MRQDDLTPEQQTAIAQLLIQRTQEGALSWTQTEHHGAPGEYDVTEFATYLPVPAPQRGPPWRIEVSNEHAPARVLLSRDNPHTVTRVWLSHTPAMALWSFLNDQFSAMDREVLDVDGAFAALEAKSKKIFNLNLVFSPDPPLPVAVYIDGEPHRLVPGASPGLYVCAPDVKIRSGQTVQIGWAPENMP